MMAPARNSLFRDHPRRLDIPVLVLASLVMLVIGLNMPVVTQSSALAADSSYSILAGIPKFWHAGQYLLSALVLAFSVIFPVAKLTVLLWLWFVPSTSARRGVQLQIIEPLGKWSMLDVLAVILLVGAVRLGLLANASIQAGAYVYGAAVLGSMIAATLMGQLTAPTQPARRQLRRRSWLLPLVAAIGLVLLAGGIFLPLMRIEKWVFWQEQYSIANGAVELLRDGQATMAIAFALFVIVLPLLLQLAHVLLALIQLRGHGGGRLVAWLIEINRWTMTDVFALALLVALLRLSGWSHLQPLAGLYLFVAGVAVSSVVSVWIRYLYRPPSRGSSDAATTDGAPS